MPADEGGKLDFKIDLGIRRRARRVSSRRRIDPLARRRDAARPADRPVLQDRRRTIRRWSAARATTRARSSRASARRRFSCAATRVGYVPIGTNPWRGPPVPYGTPMDTQEDHTTSRQRTSCRPTSSRSSRRRRITIRGRRWCSCRRACSRAGARAQRAVPAAGAAERQRPATAVAVLRAAGPGRAAVRHGTAPDARRLRRRRRPPPPLDAGATAARRRRRSRRPAVRRTLPTTRTARSSTRRAERRAAHPGTDKLAPAENWVDLMLGSKAGVMTEDTASTADGEATKQARRRASRAAGPAAQARRATAPSATGVSAELRRCQGPAAAGRRRRRVGNPTGRWS